MVRVMPLIHTRRRAVGLVAALALPAAALTALTPVSSVAAPASGGRTATPATMQHTSYGTTLYTTHGESLRSAFQRETRTFGHLGVIRLFYGGMPAPWKSITSVVHKTRVIVSFHDKPSTILSGRMDAKFRTWFDTAPTEIVTRWSYYHEPEDDAKAGKLNLVQYRAAWRHLSALADQAHNPELRATLILMCWTASKGSHRKFSNYYPGSKAIDVLGFDCFNGGHRANRYRPPANQLRTVSRLAARLHKPWGIAELGSILVKGDKGNGRANWLRAAARYTHANGGNFVSYFDSARGVDYRLHDGPSKAAWRATVKTSG